FMADRVYRLERTGRSFALQEVTVMPPVNKSYPLASEINALSKYDWVQVAEEFGAVVGLVAMGIESWNRRAKLHHLYLAPVVRGMGVGRAMVERVVTEAGHRGASRLWVETQTTNYGAIQFYERLGFEWCGLDTSLYEASESVEGEIALFF